MDNQQSLKRQHRGVLPCAKEKEGPGRTRSLIYAVLVLPRNVRSGLTVADEDILTSRLPEYGID